MILCSTRTPFLCAALALGCASTGNGQASEPAEAQTSQAAASSAANSENQDPAPTAAESGDEPRRVADSKRDQAIAECEECRGKWGKHGLAQVEGCICRTSDFGKPCADGDDCEGVCLQKGAEFKCSEFATVFGCYSFLPRGWSKRADKDKQPIPRICLD